MSYATVMRDQRLEDVRDEEEEVGRRWVALSQSASAGDPWARTFVDHHRPLGRGEEVRDPSDPCVREAASIEDLQQAIPTDGVKRLGEVELDDEHGDLASMAALDELGGEDEIFGDRAAFEEASLVEVDEPGDLLLEAGGHGLGSDLDRAVL